jgi:hypothetical protein
MIFIFCIVTGRSEIIINEAKTIQINFGLSYTNAGSLFNIDGDHKPEYLDTIPARNQPTPDSIKMDAIRGIFNIKKYTAILGINYSITDKINCFLQIPLTHYTLSDKYEPTLNSTGYKLDKFPAFDFSLTQPEHYLIGGRYRIDSAKISPIVTAAVSIPPTFRNGYQNDTVRSFKLYNSYQFFLAGAGHLQFEKAWVEAEATLALRTGDFAHEFIGKLEGGFSTVPNTSMRGFIIWTQSLSNFDKARPIYQQITTLLEYSPDISTYQENCLDVGAGFNANVINRISLDISYSIRLGLRNTFAWGSFLINMGYRL